MPVMSFVCQLEIWWHRKLSEEPKGGERKMKLQIFLLLLFLAMPIALAVDFDQEISDDDKATFDNILEPVMKIYNFVKYTATVLAVIFLIFAGVTFIMSGNNQAKRDSAKIMATYIIIGLVVIWVAPLIVGYLVG
jgi:type IV secretory pathway VirB2 component (pilin)